MMCCAESKPYLDEEQTDGLSPHRATLTDNGAELSVDTHRSKDGASARHAQQDHRGNITSNSRARNFWENYHRA